MAGEPPIRSPFGRESREVTEQLGQHERVLCKNGPVSRSERHRHGILARRNRGLQPEILSVGLSLPLLAYHELGQATSGLRRDAAKNRRLRQLNRGFVGELDFTSEGNVAELGGVEDVVFGARLRQLLSVLMSLSRGESLRPVGRFPTGPRVFHRLDKCQPANSTQPERIL